MRVRTCLGPVFTALALSVAPLSVDASLGRHGGVVPSRAKATLPSLESSADPEGVPAMVCVPTGQDPIVLADMRYPALGKEGQIVISCISEDVHEGTFPTNGWLVGVGRTARASWQEWLGEGAKVFYVGGDSRTPIVTYKVQPDQRAVAAYLFKGMNPDTACIKYDFEAMAGVPDGLNGPVTTGAFVICPVEPPAPKQPVTPAKSQPSP